MSDQADTADDRGDPADEQAVGAELERLTPDAAPAWKAAFGGELERDRRRRGVASRPRLLWLRAGAALLVGALLLLAALAQA